MGGYRERCSARLVDLELERHISIRVSVAKQVFERCQGEESMQGHEFCNSHSTSSGKAATREITLNIDGTGRQMNGEQPL